MSGITVLLPLHGDAPFLSEAIDSVRNQRAVSEVEVLIVLDRPSQPVRAFVDELRLTGLIEVAESLQPGLVAALNTGILRARYEFIARMDADDIMLPERLLIQHCFLLDHPNVAAVGGQIVYIDGQSKTLPGANPYPETDLEIRVALNSRCALAHPATMYRKSAALAVGGYRSVCNYAEDHDFWLRLADKFELANLSNRVLKYRIHEGQVSRVYAREQCVSQQLAILYSKRRRAGRQEIRPGDRHLGKLLCFQKRILRLRSRLIRRLERLNERRWTH